MQILLQIIKLKEQTYEDRDDAFLDPPQGVGNGLHKTPKSPLLIWRKTIVDQPIHLHTQASKSATHL